MQLRNFYFLDLLIAEIAKRKNISESIIRSCLPEEIEQLILGGLTFNQTYHERAKGLIYIIHENSELILPIVSNDNIKKNFSEFERDLSAESNLLKGTSICLGFHRGTCKVVIRGKSKAAINFRKGDILVSESTDPDLADLIKIAGAVVTQSGGATCHAAIICREQKVPGIMGVSGLLDKVKTGDTLIVNADEGTISILKRNKDSTIIQDYEITEKMYSVIGNKARNLSQLKQYGFQVPPYFILAVDSLIKASPGGTPDGVGPESQKLWSKLSSAVDQLSSELFALRSSMPDEDDESFSCAGMFESLIHIAREDIIHSLIELATELRAKNEYSNKGYIIIQEMILGDISGVLFTVDPVSNDQNVIVIEAVPGGNEFLTQGNVVPVRYSIDKRSLSIVRRENDEQWSNILNSGQISKLCSIAEKIRNYFGVQLDIEWTISGNDYIILQARPITGLSDQITIERRSSARLTISSISRDIASIYRTYRVPPELQLHMLKAAAISQWISDNWEGDEINVHNMLVTLLLHDIGNLVKSDYSKFPYLFPEDLSKIEYWKSVQNWLIRRYGNTDLSVAVSIAEEIGVSDRILHLIKSKQFIKNDETLKSNDFELKICAYADQRVSSQGVLPIKARLMDALRRYKNIPHASVNHPKRDNLIQCAIDIEKQIFNYMSVSPEEIHDLSVKNYVHALRSYNI